MTTARQYLREVWGKTCLRSVDDLTWDCIQENVEDAAAHGHLWPLDEALIEAREAMLDGDIGLAEEILDREQP